MVAPSPDAIKSPPADISAADDIPTNLPADVRAHIIKLREMRDQGRISKGDYESRKALLLQGR